MYLLGLLVLPAHQLTPDHQDELTPTYQDAASLYPFQISVLLQYDSASLDNPFP
jgi:hypothetical protein